MSPDTDTETETALDRAIAQRAARDLPLAVSILREAIRLPADFVDLAAEQGGDPACGESNHEGPRLRFLRRAIVEAGAVADPDDVGFDAYGNLEWTIEDRSDPTPRHEKRVVLLAGHSDTVRAGRARWRETTGGLDPYLGLVEPAALRRDGLRRELGWLPPEDAWDRLVFGLGAADQLGGVASMIVASRLLLELRAEGALRGVIVRGMITVAEEENEGGGPLYLIRRVLPGAPPEMVPDVVILTEPSGDAREGALGILRGQRGRVQIEVRLTGRPSHGSTPGEGLNPLEHGGAILAEAARRFAPDAGGRDDPFLGRGTRTATGAALETASDCTVPGRFTIRFDRRLTAGEDAGGALAEIEALDSVRAARAAGLAVEIGVPRYEEPTWRGFRPDNPRSYAGWITPDGHPAIAAAVAAYRAVVSPAVPAGSTGGALRREPRVGACVFSTDGVGFSLPADDPALAIPERKRWVRSGARRHPAMFAFGPGTVQNVHKIGECVDARELQHATAFLARFPSLFA